MCNFRVSVDGDWLCLEELNDIELDVTSQSANDNDAKDPVQLERNNLLNVLKLIIKEILDSSLSHGRMLDDNNTALQQFFLVLEHILRHGLKSKKGILRERRDFWEVLERVEKYSNDAKDITTSVRELPNVKSPLGRARAWLRLALMQKKMADYFKVLIDRRDELLCEFYDSGAVMMEEESVIISGLLVGLNVIDCSIGVKDEDLDRPMGMIDFSLYLKENQSFCIHTPMEMSRGSKQMAAILDQKNYLEELNRHLSATVTNLQQKLEGLQTANTLMKEDITIAQNNMLQLQRENSQLRSDKESLLEEHSKQLQTAQQDINSEREAYNTSRLGLDTLYQDLQNKLQDEIKAEKDLEQEMIRRRELEMIMEIMEKDLKIRQSSLVLMKKENEALKSTNAQLQADLQESLKVNTEKSLRIQKLEEDMVKFKALYPELK